MWSSVNEQITDGTSGLLPNSSPLAIVVGTCSKQLSKPITIGKKSDITDLLGVGEMPRRLKDMQLTMADCTVIAIKVDDEISGLVSPVKSNNSVELTVHGTPLGQTNISLTVLSGGTLEQANVTIDMTGDIDFSQENIDIQDGIFEIEGLGISVELPEDSLLSNGDTWEFTTTAPTAEFASIERKIVNALETYTPEFVYVAQSVNGDFAKNIAITSENLFEDHKPCLFLLETNLDSRLSVSEAITAKKEEFLGIDGRFVSVVCMDGYVRNSKGLQKRSPSGLCAGHITKANVNQSVGATNNFAISQYELPEDWLNTDSRALDEAKFITLRSYAGLDNLFWSNGRTLANDKSDYRFIEVVRTVFKAIRLARRASLPYIQSSGDAIGLQNLIVEVRSAIDTMVDKTPKELDYFNLTMPEGQDIVNNGVHLNIELFGIPVIRKILLNFAFKYNQD